MGVVWIVPLGGMCRNGATAVVLISSLGGANRGGFTTASWLTVAFSPSGLVWGTSCTTGAIWWFIT